MQLTTRIPSQISYIFVYSLVLWASVRWFFGGKKLSLEFALSFAQYSLIVFAVPVMDALTGQEMTRLLISPLDDISLMLTGVAPSTIGNVWVVAAIGAGVIFICGASYLLTVTILLAPIFSAVVLVGFVCVWLALKIQSIAPSAPLKPAMIAAFAVSTVYLSYVGCS